MLRSVENDGSEGQPGAHAPKMHAQGRGSQCYHMLTNTAISGMPTWGRIAVRYTAYNSLVASRPELRPMAAVLPDSTPPPSCMPMRTPQATLL